MSTILKALKRVDQSTPPSDSPESGPSMIDTKKAIRSRIFRIWLQRKAVFALIVLVVVIAAGWLIYSQKDRLISKIGASGQPQKPPVFQAKIEPPPRQAKEPKPQQAAPLNGQQASGRATSEPDGNSAERPSSTSSRNPSGQKDQTHQMTALKPQVRAPASKSPAKSRISGSSKTKAADSSQSNKRQPVTAPAKKSKTRAVPTARSYPRLDNAKLTLQAIAWSNIAAERIAVINDRIVREGESVEGYSINQIRQEDVVVNDGARSWQLEFGLR